MCRMVSVVMPVYNEETYIDQCIQSLLLQTFPREQMEWIFVDGMSADHTLQILESYSKAYPDLIRVLENPSKTVPYAMNLGIRHAVGTYIIRLDAHSDYAPDYIANCVRCLEATGADNVGGVAETRAKGFVGNTIAKMLSSKFGVGNSQFRTNGESGYVDTVPFGAFRRSVFSRYGGYDERLTRNQDNEMNYRIRKNGGKIYLSRDIRLSYYCRDSIKGISRMAIQNGSWNVITMWLCPGSMGLRHFIPLLFVASVMGLSVLHRLHPFFGWLLVAELAAYFTLDVLFSRKQSDSLKQFCLLMLLFPVFHVTYGCGSLLGILKLSTGNYQKNNYCPPIL